MGERLTEDEEALTGQVKMGVYVKYIQAHNANRLNIGTEYYPTRVGITRLQQWIVLILREIITNISRVTLPLIIPVFLEGLGGIAYFCHQIGL